MGNLPADKVKEWRMAALWLLLPSSSSSEVIDLERMDRAVVGALFGGGGARPTSRQTDRQADRWTDR